MALQLDISQLGADIAAQANSITDNKVKQFLRRRIGKAMELIVKIRFLTGKGAERTQWTSSAAHTKFGGRWSVNYNKRPSGATVTPGSIRLIDTGDLMNSYGIVRNTSNHVVVGPIGNVGNHPNRKIANRAETAWGNVIVGWDKMALAVMDNEIEIALNEMALGRSFNRGGSPSEASVRRH